VKRITKLEEENEKEKLLEVYKIKGREPKSTKKRPHESIKLKSKIE
jgi:hypothetical protein